MLKLRQGFVFLFADGRKQVVDRSDCPPSVYNARSENISTMIVWDTFALFELLLDSFPQCLSIARETASNNPEDTLEVKIAFTGFYQFSEPEQWTSKHSKVIHARLQGDLAVDTLIYPDECYETTKLFACLVLGALLGKLEAGEIGEAGFILGDAHLVGFLSLNCDRLCSSVL